MLYPINQCLTIGQNVLTMTHALSRCLELVHLGVCSVLHKFLLKVCTNTGILLQSIQNENPRRGEDTNEGCMTWKLLQRDQDLKMINLNAKHPPKSKSSWHTSKLIKWNYYIYKRADFFSPFVPQHSAGKNPK